ncbi:MAG: hypothetical protein JSU94_04105 [Phycisphaerales bacterium]|nr:MAG: hypothetical protein JSU94_04105 [Phycisphaerales bacterium]
MAGMFYSLEEAAQKLNRTPDQLKEMVKRGMLREFLHENKVWFKVDEVESLVAGEGAAAPAAEPGLPEPPEFEDLELEPAEGEGLDQELSDIEIPELEALEPELGEAGPVEPALEIPEAEEPAPVEPELEIPEAPEPATPEPEAAAPAKTPADTEEIFLAPETGAPVIPSELTDADTALTGEGISVLGETDKDYEVTDDTMAETTGTLGATGTTPEASLEEIEGDVNLDSFGSGSGLLDLSLQADDTSLGGILDEIYTSESEGVEEPAEAGTVEEVVAEADQMLSDEEFAAAQAGPEFAPVGRAYIEAAPDRQSNILGMMLFVPLFIVLYTAIVAVAGLRGVVPSILTWIQGFVWYVMIGLLVVALGWSGAAYWLTREVSAAPQREKKAKPAKKRKKAKKGKGPASPEDAMV